MTFVFPSSRPAAAVVLSPAPVVVLVTAILFKKPGKQANKATRLLDGRLGVIEQRVGVCSVAETRK